MNLTLPHFTVEAVRDAKGKARIYCGVDFKAMTLGFNGPRFSHKPLPSELRTVTVCVTVGAPNAQLLVAAPTVNVEGRAQGTTRHIYKRDAAGELVESFATPA
jgi:hypothetical protein